MTSKMTSEKCNEPRSEELCGSGRKFQLSWKAKYNWIDGQTSCLCSACTSPGSRNLLWGGRFTRGAAMYAKLFERRRGVQSAYDGGGGGCSRQVTLINSSLTCTHSLLKHKEHHGKRVHSAPALSCSTASLTFVRTTELSGLFKYGATHYL